MIQISHLKKVYGDKTVIDIPELTIRDGQLIGLVGNNGAGKTTLMRLILDLIKADEGQVENDGQPVNESDDWKTFTGSFIDGRFLIDFFTPEEYFAFIGKVYGLNEATIHQRLAGFEQLMHGEILGTKKYLRDFSEGNRQKVGIIGAMLPSSQILISKMIERECRERGTTVILSSHNLNVVSDISTRILLLEKGVVVKDLANDAGSAMTELEAYFDTTQPASEDRQDLSD